MGYKEKFEDFLDKMQGLLDNAKKQGHIIIRVEDLEKAFPELKESEDERIRKKLISLFQSDAPQQFGEFTNKQFITWLEKQGEQNPFNYENATIVQKDFASIEPRYNIGDILCDKSCTTLNKDAQPNFEIVDIKDGLYICDKGSIPISQQDEYELVAKKIEQKPAWSEEDKKTLERVIRCIENHDYMNVDDIHWLKSLKERYTWKPSEEQMTTLEYYMHTLVCNEHKEILFGLYQDLKKLREK